MRLALQRPCNRPLPLLARSTDYSTSFDTGDGALGTSYLSALNQLRVVTATTGQAVVVSTTDLTRWDGAVAYTLNNLSDTYNSNNGMFDSVQQRVYRQTQIFGNPEDCVVNIRFTVTPVTD